MAIKAAVIKSHERIRAICKEPHARRHGGQLVQWFITDKYGRLLLSSGKLSALQAYMNAHATSPWLVFFYYSLCSHTRDPQRQHAG